MPSSQWCPPEITAAAVPLADIGRLMRTLSEDRAPVVDLLRSAPLHEVRDAFEEFLHRWMLTLWDVSGEANSLASVLRWAAQDYVGLETDLSRGLTAGGS